MVAIEYLIMRLQDLGYQVSQYCAAAMRPDLVTYDRSIGQIEMPNCQIGSCVQYFIHKHV